MTGLISTSMVHPTRMELVHLFDRLCKRLSDEVRIRTELQTELMKLQIEVRRLKGELL